ncbi:ABC transporter permease [Deinococcus yavapaiensis]|uniref:Thiamine transport system permease protein n=1 Tax=Deinococcus yavapaiensis KR-236 TaxID=694435 RepID=A0A318S461_9DEIO|nr:iron ABC transporter permease [Deinococcus yavapaiensis]PYE52850.1 thiamine transport system permease protein [Deinococcus yavapaiensis KR-236]
MTESRRALLAAPFLALLAAFLIAPLLRTLAEGGVSVGLLRDPYFQSRLVWTFGGATLSAVLAALVGVPLAWGLAGYRVRGASFLLRALLLPFVTPTLVAAMGLTALVGPRGWLKLDLSETPAIVVLGNLFFNLPLVVRLSHAAFSRVPSELEASARSLGASPLRAFARVTLPLAAPGLLAGVVLVFLYSALSFGLPYLLGGERYATLEVEVYALALLEGRLSEASALVAVQLVVTTPALLAYLRLARSTPLGVATRLPHRSAPLAVRLVLAAFLGFTLLVCFGPLVAVAAKSLLGPDGLTLAFWSGVASSDDPPLSFLLLNTVRFGVLTLIAAVALGVAFSLAAARSNVLDFVSLAPLVVSPVSLGVGFLLLYPRLLAELPLLVAAYVLLSTPLVVRSLLPALRDVPRGLLDLARTLGATPGQVLRRVTFPLVLPALRGGAALALAATFGEFAATLVLSRPEWATLSLGVAEKLSRPGERNLGEACALATLLMGLALAGFAALDGGRGDVT